MKKIIIIICGIFLTISTYAQRSELGVMLGTSYYLGDINPSRQFYKPNFAGGLIYRYNLNPHWALKLNALYGTVEASDADFGNIRNLSFKSHILEFSSQIELNFWEYFTGSKSHRFSPYIFAGVAIFNYNPQAIDSAGVWHDLQPLGTEGQGTINYPTKKVYGLTQLSIPFGLGFKFSVSKVICIGAEWGLRKTFVDYIDDVSTTYVDRNVLAGEKGLIAGYLADRTTELFYQDPLNPTKIIHRPSNLEGESRGNSSTTDWYSFAGVTITFKLGYKSRPSCFDKGFNYKENIYY
ncbi:MAG: outer membrane beta-barrel protein [Bacteroidetes bacterium]|nr:outer membrane beta-barrel protein [Bacteroidota bacterium]